jgi:hypothetical protein
VAHSDSQTPLRERYVSAFVEPALRSALERSAREHDRSLSGEIRTALRLYLADRSDRGAPVARSVASGDAAEGGQ